MIHAMKSTRKYVSPLRREQARATRERILQAYFEEVGERGTTNVSVPSVAERAGVSVRSVYHHFPSKDDLIAVSSEWVGKKLFGDSGEPVPPQSPGELYELMRETMPKMAAQAPVFRAIMASGFRDESAAERAEYRRKLIAGALAPAIGDLEAADQRRLVALGVLFFSHDGVSRLVDAGELSPEDAAITAAWALEALVDRARRSGQIVRTNTKRDKKSR
jgi:AcrR family transcriptional regulator